MISLNINITTNWIELDFHGSQRSFGDFNALWDFCLLTASNKGIYKIKMIHGRGRDADGLAFIDDSIRARLDRLRGVRWFKPEKGKLGVTLVYLSDNLNQYGKHKSSHQKLMQLSKDLKEEEMFTKKRKDVVDDSSTQIEATLRSLDTEWNETVVLETAQSLLDSGDADLLLRLLDEIKIFEIFYTENFRNQLSRVITELDELER